MVISSCYVQYRAQDQVLVESITPPDEPLLLYPTPCAMDTSLNNARVLLAGEGLFDDPVRDLTDVGDGDGNLIARTQVLRRSSGVTNPFGGASQKYVPGQQGHRQRELIYELGDGEDQELGVGVMLLHIVYLTQNL